jgi:hypothetical protein
LEKLLELTLLLSRARSRNSNKLHTTIGTKLQIIT